MVPLRYAWHAKTAIAVRFRCLRCNVRVELLELRRIIDQSDQLVPDTAAPCRTVRNMLSHFQTCHAQCHHAEAAHVCQPLTQWNARAPDDAPLKLGALRHELGSLGIYAPWHCCIRRLHARRPVRDDSSMEGRPYVPRTPPGASAPRRPATIRKVPTDAAWARARVTKPFTKQSLPPVKPFRAHI